MKRLLLQLYRFGIVGIIAWLIRDVAVRQRTLGDSPVRVAEVKEFFPAAAALRPDDSARDGLFVLDPAHRELGYVVRTQPQCADIIGYCGVTDVLIALNPEWKIVGLKVHASDDTRDYVENVTLDRRFLQKWNGLSWGAAAELDLEAAGIEGVSGATMTSMAIARSVKARLQARRDEIVARPVLHWSWHDLGLVVVITTAALLAFGPAAWRHRWKPWFQIALVVYVGFIAGDFVAQKLLAGWARAAIPWTTAPALVLLAAAAFVIPWTTRRPFYCHHVCPHGAVQEWLSHVRPARWQWTLPAGVVRGLEYLPAGLLLLVLVTAMLALPLDLAGIEPFAAYGLRAAGGATVAVAVIGLVASAFVPQAYCRFGCPTGALLNFVRTRGATDRFSRRDVLALAFLVAALALYWQDAAVLRWIKGLP